MIPVLLQVELSLQLIISICFFVVAAFISVSLYFLKRRVTDSCNQLLEKKDLEKKLGILQAKQEERSRISADLHDDLGGGLTSIRLYAELAVERPGSGAMPEVHRISALSNDLINSMNAIIWTMDVANDTLSNLIIYLRKVAIDYFEATNIEVVINAVEDVPEIEVAGEKRRNIYLVVKEILANILKHASASHVEINFMYAAKLLITVKDNGTGYMPGIKKREGSGIKNMHRRIAQLGGKIRIENNAGTSVALEIPVE